MTGETVAPGDGPHGRQTQPGPQIQQVTAVQQVQAVQQVLPDRQGQSGPRGRVLVIEGGNGQSPRRFPPRAGRPAPGLSTIIAAIAPQVLLAADAVDTVHLTAATDASGVLAHLRSAVRHPGPLLVHIGGHLVRDRRTGGAELDLGDSRLPWASVAEEIRLRPAETATLVVADLSAEEAVLPPLRVVPSPLGAGMPLWAAVTPDPQQVGTFTRALIEALHGGRPGANGMLTPEELHQQVHSVLRPEVVLVATHAPGRQIFRNTARRLEAAPQQQPVPMPAPGAVAVAGAMDPPPFDTPPLPPTAPTVHLRALDENAHADTGTAAPAEPPAEDPAPDDYRVAIGVIVAAADAGEHTRAVSFAQELEDEAVAEHGPHAEVSLRVRQVHAHVARLAGKQADATELYRAVALSLLETRGSDDPETTQAAANAEACWRAIEDDDEARRLGPDLLALRRDVPDTSRPGSVERHLARLTGSLTSS
ncbi:hypothetical protein ABUW04_15170 [Streptacidiphilus sp. N1-10]|uniref:Tetratricopeptide repeat protein n=1 Tax=Streptacidiphilus jeojiensis TaxID=3229225 RepID=A0ABV6XNK5_9ACTN